MKFNSSNVIKNSIKLTKENLSFCTTVAFNCSNQNFLSKIVKYFKMQINVQLALQVDDQKITVDGKLDLKDILVYQSLY